MARSLIARVASPLPTAACAPRRPAGALFTRVEDHARLRMTNQPLRRSLNKLLSSGRLHPSSGAHRIGGGRVRRWGATNNGLSCTETRGTPHTCASPPKIGTGIDFARIHGKTRLRAESSLAHFRCCNDRDSVEGMRDGG